MSLEPMNSGYKSGVPPDDERPESRGDLDSFLADEDIYLLSPHVKVEYLEVFKEADGANSCWVLAKVSGFIFKWTQLGLYRLFVVIFGLLAVFFWGILFALINFFTVYMIQPSLKLNFIILRPPAMMFKAIMRSFCDPLNRSFGLIFSRIMGRVAFNFTGLPGQKPTRQAAIEEV